VSHTPVTPAGLRSLDHLGPLDAVVRAWTDPGPHPQWHRKMQAEVRDSMPLLARALDRLTAERRLRRGSAGGQQETAHGRGAMSDETVWLLIGLNPADSSQGGGRAYVTVSAYRSRAGADAARQAAEDRDRGWGVRYEVRPAKVLP
jgi:hypothetical protein